MREPSVRLRADQTSASKIDAWLHRRGRAAPAAPEPEPEHERERLPGIDAGARGPESRLQLAPHEQINRRIRSSLRRIRTPEADTAIGEPPIYQ